MAHLQRKEDLGWCHHILAIHKANVPRPHTACPQGAETRLHYTSVALAVSLSIINETIDLRIGKSSRNYPGTWNKPPGSHMRSSSRLSVINVPSLSVAHRLCVFRSMCIARTPIYIRTYPCFVHTRLAVYKRIEWHLHSGGGV
jgi:hypothetical protein